MKRHNILALLMMASLPAMAWQTDSVEIGANRSFSVDETTAAVSVIKSSEINKRTAKDIGNAVIGQGLGLISLQASGNYASANPTFYVRGLQSLSSSSPLILVDGIEREIKNIMPEEVESVTILKDAAAVALYGYKGVNGAVLVTTKRGQENSRQLKFTYDHSFNFMARKPKFADAYTYANAVNEARMNDGLSAMYSPEALEAFRNGTLPYSYPNVNWVDETFRDNGVTNRYIMEFLGGTQKFRYFTMLSLVSDKGFINNANLNDGYSTQNKYVRGNLRINLDADITKSTKMKVNVLGVLAESSRPGASADLWNMVYSIPSAAFPVTTESGLYGGNTTWSGEQNPVVQATGAAYVKNHTRSLFADLTLNQDLSSITKGLSATSRLSYDNTSNIYENHSKTYEYGMAVPGLWNDGAPVISQYKAGKESAMGSAADTNDYSHRFHFNIGVNYDRCFGDNALYTQLRWDYDNEEFYGVNNTVFRKDFSWFTHYGYKDRYFADLALVWSGSSRLAPGTKWSFSPTVSLAWLISGEKFMKDVKLVDRLKMRLSAGILNADYLPENTWTYYLQGYDISSGTYNFTSNYNTGGVGGTTLGRVSTMSPSNEKAYKYNIGIDARLFGALDVTFDAFYQHRTDIWVKSDGKYTNIVGYDKPFENAGIVNSWGFELGLDYTKTFGAVTLNAGTSLNVNRSKVTELLEEPKMYDNLVITNHRLNQIFGLEAIGLFRDQADIDASPVQTFSAVKPGDIKYRDVNGDNIIDANDKVAIGYNTKAPEVFYNFHIGAEYKGFGIYMLFQGAGRYSAVLNTKSLYWPLVGNNTISTEVHENRWTPENMNAKYPRLSSESNANNYQTNTLWLASRSFLKMRDIEVYYNLPESLLLKTKFVSGAKLYLRGTDLLCFDSIYITDPENYGATNPMTRSVVLGLAVTF